VTTVKRIDEIIARLRALKPELQRRYAIREMGVFGSYVRGEEREDSDLDVLVEPGDGLTLPDYAGLQSELSVALGIKVDLANRRTLRRRIGERILAEVRMV
jgi:predicted nucleotidyltransferase